MYTLQYSVKDKIITIIFHVSIYAKPHLENCVKILFNAQALLFIY